MTQPANFGLSRPHKVLFDVKNLGADTTAANSGFFGIFFWQESIPGDNTQDFGPIIDLGNMWIAHAAVTEATDLVTGAPHIGAAKFTTQGCELDQVGRSVRVFWHLDWNWPLPTNIGIIIGHIGGLPVGLPWTTITLDAGWGQFAGGQTPRCRILPNGNVQLKGRIAHAGFNGATVINAANPLPPDFRPSANLYPLRGDSHSAGLEILAGGVLVAEPFGTSTNCDINCIYASAAADV